MGGKTWLSSRPVAPADGAGLRAIRRNSTVGVGMKRQPFARGVREIVWNKTGGKCSYCGKELHNQDIFDWGGKVVLTISLWDIDHVIPVSKGSGNEINNLVPTCQTCNRKKGAK